MTRVAVVGTGYVGLTVGVCLAHLGHEVVCADIDNDKVTRLNAGIPTISEPGIEELLHEGLSSGRLKFVLGAAAACQDAEVHFLCLPTPSGAAGEADMSAMLAALDEIRTVLADGSVVVNKSTLPIGTAELVSDIINRAEISVVSNPEFLREGAAVEDFLQPDRVVVGSADPAAARVVADLYNSLDARVVSMDARSAEMVKYASNAMLAVRLSFVNEIADLCARSGVHIDPVIEGVGLDMRIGSNHLTPGPGWGGSCFPKDSLALAKHARDVGTRISLVETAIEQNARWMSAQTCQIANALPGGLSGATVGVWGLTFKALTDDRRDSPAITIIDELQRGGATVQAYDPTVKSCIHELPDLIVTPSPIAAATRADVVVVLTEWPEFAGIDAVDIASAMNGDVVIDTRGVVCRPSVEAVGLRYLGLGQHVSPTASTA